MANDPQGMFKDLMSTIEEKVNKPLAQSSGKLTSQFFSEPGSFRQNIQQQNVGNPVDPLQVDKLVGQRRGNIAGQLELNQGLSSANNDILGSYFNFISNLAEQSRQSQAAKQPNLQLIETADGLRTFNPQDGTLGDIVGQPPGDPGIEAEAQRYASLIEQGFFTKNGRIDTSGLPAKYRDRALEIYSQKAASQPQQGGPNLGRILGGAGSLGAAGAGTGAALGLLGGPLAPLTVPVGAGIGGLLGAGVGAATGFFNRR